MRTMLFSYASLTTNNLSPVRVNLNGLFLANPVFEGISMGSVFNFLSLDIFGLFGLLFALLCLYHLPWKKSIYLLVWLVPFYAWLYLMQTPHDARYLLPIIAPFSILLVQGFEKIQDKKWIWVLLLIFVAGSFIRGGGMAWTVHTEETPRLQAVNYIVENYGTDVTAIGYGQSHHFRWYAPEINYIEGGYRGDGIDTSALQGKVLINLRTAEYKNIPTHNCATFTRDPHVHILHHRKMRKYAASFRNLAYPQADDHIRAKGLNRAALKQNLAGTGNNQTGTVGQPLTNPFIVRITGDLDNPVFDVEVTFTITDGGGSLSTTLQTTDANGEAQTTLTLGTTAGTDNNTVEKREREYSKSLIIDGGQDGSIELF